MPGKTPRYVALLVVVAASLWPSSLMAQQVAIAQVTGQVTDANGAVIEGAKVEMTELDRGIVHTVTTDVNGNYVFPGLPVGPYNLGVSKTGFKAYKLDRTARQ